MRENISVLLIFLVGGFYGIATGYRWSVLPQPKLDIDWALGILALIISLFCMALIPFAGFIYPIVKISLERNVGTPFTVVVLLAGLSGLFGYFGYDDLTTYYRNAAVPFRVRVEKTYLQNYGCSWIVLLRGFSYSFGQDYRRGAWMAALFCPSSNYYTPHILFEKEIS